MDRPAYEGVPREPQAVGWVATSVTWTSSHLSYSAPHRVSLRMMPHRYRAGHRCRWCHPQGAEGPQGSGCSPGSHRLKLSRS